MDTPSAGDSRQPVRLLLVGGPTSDRRALAGLLASQASADVVAELDIDEALLTPLAWRPEGVLIDTQLPDVNAVLLARSIRTHQRDSAIIFLTSHTDARTLVATVFGRAAGHVVKTLDGAALLSAVERVLRGDHGTGQTTALIRWYEERSSSATARGSWQARDLDLLRLIASDQPDAATAAALGIDQVTLRLAISELYLALSEDIEFLKVGATLARMLR